MYSFIKKFLALGIETTNDTAKSSPFTDNLEHQKSALIDRVTNQNVQQFEACKRAIANIIYYTDKIKDLTHVKTKIEGFWQSDKAINTECETQSIQNAWRKIEFTYKNSEKNHSWNKETKEEIHENARKDAESTYNEVLDKIKREIKQCEEKTIELTALKNTTSRLVIKKATLIENIFERLDKLSKERKQELDRLIQKENPTADEIKKRNELTKKDKTVDFSTSLLARSIHEGDFSIAKNLLDLRENANVTIGTPPTELLWNVLHYNPFTLQEKHGLNKYRFIESLLENGATPKTLLTGFDSAFQMTGEQAERAGRDSNEATQLFVEEMLSLLNKHAPEIKQQLHNHLLRKNRETYSQKNIKIVTEYRTLIENQRKTGIKDYEVVPMALGRLKHKRKFIPVLSEIRENKISSLLSKSELSEKLILKGLNEQLQTALIFNNFTSAEQLLKTGANPALLSDEKWLAAIKQEFVKQNCDKEVRRVDQLRLEWAQLDKKIDKLDREFEKDPYTDVAIRNKEYSATCRSLHNVNQKIEQSVYGSTSVRELLYKATTDFLDALEKLQGKYVPVAVTPKTTPPASVESKSSWRKQFEVILERFKQRERESARIAKDQPPQKGERNERALLLLTGASFLLKRQGIFSNNRTPTPTPRSRCPSQEIARNRQP